MLLVLGPLDRETNDIYELVIVAADKGTPQRQVLYTKHSGLIYRDPSPSNQYHITIAVPYHNTVHHNTITDNIKVLRSLPSYTKLVSTIPTPLHQNITSIRVSVTDVNDNTPVFSANTYTKSILVKDAKVGDVLLSLSATDTDMGLNALVTYRLAVHCCPTHTHLF